jgi:hypothetical protein
MAINYTKLFHSMLDSSVWMLSKEARILWITLLLKKDMDHVVRAAIPGLAHAARLTIEETEKSLEELSKPDPYSQSPAEQGRRIKRVEAGWLVVNGEHYLGKFGPEERREYKRQWQAAYRSRKKKARHEGYVAGATQAIEDGLKQAMARPLDNGKGGDV